MQVSPLFFARERYQMIPATIKTRIAITMMFSIFYFVPFALFARADNSATAANIAKTTARP